MRSDDGILYSWTSVIPMAFMLGEEMDSFIFLKLLKPAIDLLSPEPSVFIWIDTLPPCPSVIVRLNVLEFGSHVSVMLGEPV
ncbi:MAG: hypothetical protein ACP5LZ_07255 [Fervidicoccaceae archaeon]